MSGTTGAHVCWCVSVALSHCNLPSGQKEDPVSLLVMMVGDALTGTCDRTTTCQVNS